MKKLTAAALAAALVWTGAPAALGAEGAPSLSARAAVVMEAESGQVLMEQRADEPMLIASTTKIMTALVALERCGLDDTVTVDPAWTGIEGSSMYLVPGQELTVRELLYGMMLASGNDAAVALACTAAGSVEAFAELMNAKAMELGCANTHFTNANGLDGPEHYASARDLALITREALRHEDFRRIVSTGRVTMGGRTYTNHNRLLGDCEGVFGVKTGYTKAAGRSLVTCCEREGLTLICVTLSDPDDWDDHRSLYDWAYGLYGREDVLAGAAWSVPVIGGVAEAVPVIPADDLSVFRRDGETVRLYYRLPPFVYADVQAGEQAGEAVAYIGGREAGRTALVFAWDVAQAQAGTPTFWERVRDMLGLEEGSVYTFMRQRLQKLISGAGIASRRAAEEMIRAGRVTVNGVPASLGDGADPDTDDILVDGQALRLPRGRRYIVLHKPRGYVTTLRDDRGRPTVAELVADAGGRLYPAGRLDMDSEGLLILTDDGRAANALTHPSHRVDKVYTVFVQGEDIHGAIGRLRAMEDLDGEPIARPGVNLVERRGAGAELQIVIHEGKNRQVRRMCAACGLHVSRLIRVAEGPVTLGDLPPGKWRRMTPDEISYLQNI